MKVLVADDSLSIRRIIKGILATVSVTDVDEAADGAEALAMFRTRAYDLVLLDWNMPRLLGIEVLAAIRGQGSSVPVIMVTSEAEKQSVIQALKAGASNYVIKPFDRKTLLAKIDQVVPAAV